MVHYDVRVMSLHLLESMRVIVRCDDGILKIDSDGVASKEVTTAPKP